MVMEVMWCWCCVPWAWSCIVASQGRTMPTVVSFPHQSLSRLLQYSLVHGWDGVCNCLKWTTKKNWNVKILTRFDIQNLFSIRYGSGLC